MRSPESAKVTARAVLTLAALAALTASGCGPDPSKDYDDWLRDTAGLRGAQPGAGGAGGHAQDGCSAEQPRPLTPSDPLPPTEGVYVATCLANVSACDIKKELRFRVDLGSPGPGGVAPATWRALTATGRAAQDISSGSPPFSAPLVFAADGSMKTETPVTTSLSADANAISLRPLDLTNVTFSGYYFTDGGPPALLCAEFDGLARVHMATGQPPDEVDLTPKGDVCLLTRVDAEDQAVDPPKSAYHCP